MSDEAESEPPRRTLIGRYVDDETVSIGFKGEQGGTALRLKPADAAVLGRSILGASVACLAASDKPPPGTEIDDPALRVTRWTVSRSKRSGQVLLRLEIPGGTPLTFVMRPHVAEGCAATLARVAAEATA